jgi:hypothetical protein
MVAVTTRRGLNVTAVFALLTLADCNKPKVATSETYVGPRTPRPDRLVVQAFAVTPADVKLDQGVAARVERANGDVPLTTRQLQVARQAQSDLADAMVEQLRQYGLPAERLWGTAPPTGRLVLLVQGQIVSVDQGNRTRRTLVGLGAGKSSVSADMQLFMLDGPVPPRFLTAFSGSDDSGRTPGMAETMGIGAVGGHVLASAAVGAGIHAHAETHGATSDSQAASLGRGLAKEIGQFAVSQGWIAPDAIR